MAVLELVVLRRVHRRGLTNAFITCR